MTISRISAIGPALLGGTAATAGAASSDPAAADSAPAAARPGAAGAAKASAGAAPSSASAAARAAHAKSAADSLAAPIGTQMVLVFDDQSHAMTIKMLDIETQKVEQGARAAPASAQPDGAQEPVSVASGALVNTKV